MRSILEELFYGNICPNTDCRSHDKETKQLMGYIADHHDNLLSTLNDQQKELLEKFDDCYNELTDINEREIFSYAFKLGARMMIEVLSFSDYQGGNDMDKSTFLINMGRRIAKARKDVGLSQASLAEKADISEIHMSNIERGKKNPSADVLCRISEILNISVDVILLPDIDTSKRMLNDELENLLGDLTSYEREKIYSIIKNIKQLMKKEK